MESWAFQGTFSSCLQRFDIRLKKYHPVAKKLRPISIYHLRLSPLPFDHQYRSFLSKFGKDVVLTQKFCLETKISRSESTDSIHQIKKQNLTTFLQLSKNITNSEGSILGKIINPFQSN